MTKEEKEKEAKRKLEEASQRFDNGEVEDESEEEPETPETKPESVIQPKYKIVYSYPVDLGDAWGGYTTA